MRALPATLCIALTLPGAAVAGGARHVTGTLVTHADPPETGQILVEVRDTAGVLRAETRFPRGAQGSPVHFDIAVPSGQALTLTAGILTAARPRLASRPRTIAPGRGDVALGPLPLAPVVSEGFPVVLRCGAAELAVATVGRGARLRAGGSTIDLARVRTASGAKFAAPGAPAATWVWLKGNAATVRLDGTTLADCAAALSAPARRFEAHGIEPGWRLTVRGTRLRYSGAYGTTTIAAPLPAPLAEDGAATFALPGRDLTMRVALALCRDAATGMPHPVRVRVSHAGRTVAGCGGHPARLLRGLDWRVTRLGGQAIARGHQPRLRFGPRGRLTATGGCAALAASYALTPARLRISDVTTAPAACTAREAVARDRLAAALGGVRHFDFGPGGALSLRGAGARLTARLAPRRLDGIDPPWKRHLHHHRR